MSCLRVFQPRTLNSEPRTLNLQPRTQNPAYYGNRGPAGAGARVGPGDGAGTGGRLRWSVATGLRRPQWRLISYFDRQRERPRVVYEDSRLRLWWPAARQDVICEVPAEITGDDVYQTLRMVSLNGRFWEEIEGVLKKA
jgi:hypothetical protein